MAAEPTTLPGVWSKRWAAVPSLPAMRVLGGSGPGGAGQKGPRAPNARGWCSAGELDDRSRRAAGLLAAAGLAPGERLLWSAAPSLEGVVTVVAALRLGAVLVPASPVLTEPELSHVVADVRPRVAVLDRPEQVPWVTAAAQGAAVLEPGLAQAGGSEQRSPGSRFSDASLSEPGAEPAAEGLLDRARPDDPALIVYTSGTTGRPKGAVLSHGNLVAGIRAVQEAWRWREDDRLVLALPLFHVHGLCIGLLGTLTVGASTVVLPRFDAGGVLEAAATERATLFFGVPTMYHRLLASGRAGELAGLRLCVSGSAPLPAALWEELRRRAGVAVLERYGMSETLLTLSNPYEGERRPGTVGFPLPGVAARLAGEATSAEGARPEDLHDATPATGAGELHVAGPSVFAGYWERPAATAECFVDGWFRTGDLAAVDGDGYYSILGRRGDLIITGGHNVYPAEVEDALLAHPSVAEVAVSGTPSSEWGEAVTAWIVPDGTAASPEELLAFVADRLAPYKWPREFRFVETLPRNSMGKIQRHELR